MLETSQNASKSSNAPVGPSEYKLFPPLHCLVGLCLINSGFTGRQSPGRERSCGSTKYSNKLQRGSAAIPAEKQMGAVSCLPGGWPEQHWSVIHSLLENQNPQDLTPRLSRARNNRAGWRPLRNRHKSFFPQLGSHADSSEFFYQPLMARKKDLDKVVYSSQVLA